MVTKQQISEFDDQKVKELEEMNSQVSETSVVGEHQVTLNLSILQAVESCEKSLARGLLYNLAHY